MSSACYPMRGQNHLHTYTIRLPLFFSAAFFSLVVMMLSFVHVYGTVTFRFFRIFIKYFMLLSVHPNGLHTAIYPLANVQLWEHFLQLHQNHIFAYHCRNKFSSLDGWIPWWFIWTPFQFIAFFFGGIMFRSNVWMLCEVGNFCMKYE